MNAHVDALLPQLVKHGVTESTNAPAHSPALLHLNPSLRWRALLRDIHHARHARSQGARILIHLHGWSPRLAAGLTRARLHGLDWHHVRLMALGHTFRDALIRMGVPADRIGIMGPCARASDLSPWNPDGPWLFLGRLEPGKGAEELLRATRRPVVIAGEGSQRRRLEALAQRLGVQARFTGWLHDVMPLLDEAGALVLPSHQEGLPVAILEALGSRRPVVATDVGAVREVVPNAVPVGDVRALDVALQNVVGVSQARANAIRERYSPQAVAAQCLDAYQTLLDEP